MKKNKDLIAKGAVIKLSFNPQVHQAQYAGIEPFGVVVGTGTDSVTHVETVTAALLGPYKGMFITGDRTIKTNGPCNGWILKRAVTSVFPLSSIEGVTGERVLGSMLEPQVPDELLPDGIIYWGDRAEQIKGLYNDFDAFEADLMARRELYLNFLERTAEYLPPIKKTASGIVHPDEIVRDQLKEATLEGSLFHEEGDLPGEYALSALGSFSPETLKDIIFDWGIFSSSPAALLLQAAAAVSLYLKSGKIADQKNALYRVASLEGFYKN